MMRFPLPGVDPRLESSSGALERLLEEVLAGGGGGDPREGDPSPA